MTEVEIPSARWPDAVVTPAGTATLRGPQELTMRQARSSTAALIDFGPIARRVQDLTRARSEGASDSVTPLTEEERATACRFSDVAIVTYLESWDLDRDLPTLATVSDLPSPIYDALAQAAIAQLTAKHALESTGE
jgi:hypothetical protein